MPALLKIKRSIENDVWKVLFSLDAASLSEDDKDRIRKFGEPQINVGGALTFVSTIPLLVPTVTWANPTGIAVGTNLSSTQLNATASVPGTFVYTPPAGTALVAGAAQQLAVTFTPTDTAIYASVTKYATITVVPFGNTPPGADAPATQPAQVPVYPTRTITKPNKYIRVRADLPYTQEFDSKSPDVTLDAQVQALAYQTKFVTAYETAFDDLRTAVDTFTGEFIANI